QTARNALKMYSRAGKSDLLKRTWHARDHRPVLSLDDPIHDEDASISYADRLVAADLVAPGTPTLTRSPQFRALYECLQTLSSINREALCMRYGLCGYGEHEATEIAAILGISLRAAKARVEHGIEQLRKHPELLHVLSRFQQSGGPDRPTE